MLSEDIMLPAPPLALAARAAMMPPAQAPVNDSLLLDICDSLSFGRFDLLLSALPAKTFPRLLAGG